MNKLLSLLFLCTCFFMSCDPPSQISSTTPSVKDTSKPVEVDQTGRTCRTMATVKDMTGLDGCKMMLLLKDGTKLLPAKIKGDFKLKDGMTVLMDYQKTEGTMTICMAEDMIVEVTCIREIKTGGVMPEVNQCVETIDHQSVAWMKAVEKEIKANQIVRYDHNGGWAYYFKNKKMGHLYDCRGNNICEGPHLITDDTCAKRVARMGEGVVIWIVNH